VTEKVLLDKSLCPTEDCAIMEKRSDIDISENSSLMSYRFIFASDFEMHFKHFESIPRILRMGYSVKSESCVISEAVFLVMCDPSMNEL
jgi:hypothetical protein